MTRTTPRRLMTLHRSHIGFTLALTFTILSSRLFLCPEPVSDPSPAQVVGAQLHLHPVARQYTDVVHPHLARDVRQHVVPVLQLDPELRVGQRLGYGAFNLYDGDGVLEVCRERTVGGVDGPPVPLAHADGVVAERDHGLYGEGHPRPEP